MDFLNDCTISFKYLPTLNNNRNVIEPKIGLDIAIVHENSFISFRPYVFNLTGRSYSSIKN